MTSKAAVSYGNDNDDDGDDDGPLGLEEEQPETDAETIEYDDDDEYQTGDEVEDPQFATVIEAVDKAWHYLIKECQDEEVETVDQYINRYGTRSVDGVIDGMEYEARRDNACYGSGLDGTPQGVAREPICVEFSRSMSILLVAIDGEHLPDLGEDGHYVVQ